jgi:hypothetical protein
LNPKLRKQLAAAHLPQYDAPEQVKRHSEQVDDRAALPFEARLGTPPNPLQYNSTQTLLKSTMPLTFQSMMHTKRLSGTRNRLMIVLRCSSGTYLALSVIMLGQNMPMSTSNTQNATSCTPPATFKPNASAELAGTAESAMLGISMSGSVAAWWWGGGGSRPLKLLLMLVVLWIFSKSLLLLLLLLKGAISSCSYASMPAVRATSKQACGELAMVNP